MAHIVRRPRLAVRVDRRARSRSQPRLHGRSFALAYATLALTLAGAAVAAYLFATRPAMHLKKATRLVPAQTVGLGTYALKQIAYDVQGEYRQSNGTPLVAIMARPSAPPQFVAATGPVAISAMIVHSGFAIESPLDVKTYDVSKAAMFVMCGPEPACALPAGQAANRKAELQRELVELSMLTLRKLQSLDSVLTFVPPASAKRVVYLTRGDLSSRPAESVAAGRPLSQREQRSLDALVGSHTFAVQSISPLPDGSAYLAATPRS